MFQSWGFMILPVKAAQPHFSRGKPISKFIRAKFLTHSNDYLSAQPTHFSHFQVHSLFVCSCNIKFAPGLCLLSFLPLQGKWDAIVFFPAWGSSVPTCLFLAGVTYKHPCLPTSCLHDRASSTWKQLLCPQKDLAKMSFFCIFFPEVPIFRCNEDISPFSTFVSKFG